MNKIDNQMLKRKTLDLTFSVVKYIFIISICYLFIFPFLYLLVSSVQSVNVMDDQSVVWIPKEFTLNNYVKAFQMLDFAKSFAITMLISVTATLATIFSCGMAGYSLARFKFIERNIIFFVVLVLIIIPPQTTLMSTFLNYRFFNPFGIMSIFNRKEEVAGVNLINSPLTMILPAIFASGIRAGLMIFIFRQFFLGQPKELEEAAKIDGCGVFSTYFKIMLPLSSPAIISVSVFSFVWYWNDSFYSSLFFDGDLKPLTAQLDMLRITLTSENAFVSYSPQEQKAFISAAAILCVIVPLILYMIIQKRFSESIERVGIVG